MIGRQGHAKVAHPVGTWQQPCQNAGVRRIRNRAWRECLREANSLLRQLIQTPTIDQLAKQGIRFAQAFTPSPITNTSHASILTGLLPSSHGVSDFGVPLTADHSTLAEL